MTIDIIIPSLNHPHVSECVRRLFAHTTIPFNLHVVRDGSNWAEAINIGLGRANPQNDILIIDDDVFVDAGWHDNLEQYLEQGDVLGWKLKFPNGTIQSAGGILLQMADGVFPYYHRGLFETDEGQFDTPAHAPHLTASLLYIKRKVLDELKGFNETDYRWGYQYEDVDFNQRAHQAGFKVLFIPNEAVHFMSGTKLKNKEFYFRQEINRYVFKKLWAENPEYVAWMKATFGLHRLETRVDMDAFAVLQGPVYLYAAGEICRDIVQSGAVQVAGILDGFKTGKEIFGRPLHTPPFNGLDPHIPILITLRGHEWELMEQFRHQHGLTNPLWELATRQERIAETQDPEHGPLRVVNLVIRPRRIEG